MKHEVVLKILFDAVNPWSRVDRDIPDSFCGKMQGNWCTRPLK